MDGEGNRFALGDELCEEIRKGVFSDGFMKVVQNVRRNGKVFRIAMRPVMIGGEKKFQAEMTDEGRVQAKNFDADGAAEGLEEMLAQKGARELHLITATGDLHVRVTKKGHVLASRSAPQHREAKVQDHDRVKNVPLAAFDAGALLRALGVADGDGRIRASMRGKYDQVNEFLKIVGAVLKEAPKEDAFTIVDCGCGKAYLTFALYFYLTRALGFRDVKVIGVDRRNDVIASSRRTAEDLDVADRVLFVEADLGAFDLASVSDGRADMVVSLHACDTATDEALARGVEWKARYIVSAPCCQHELQSVLGKGESGGRAFAGLMRQGILRERLCDILTDSFRAMILRILGFKTQVVEFVSPDATARNILLRAEYGVKSGQPGVVSEYLDLRDFWKVTPWLEKRLGTMLEKHLKRFED